MSTSITVGELLRTIDAGERFLLLDVRNDEEFERWKETIEVRGDAALMKEIRAGLRALRSRKARLYTLEELLG